jgi:cell division protein FtsB
VVARYAKGEKITAKNEEVRAEIENAGYNFNQIVEQAKQFGVTEEEDEA